MSAGTHHLFVTLVLLSIFRGFTIGSYGGEGARGASLPGARTGGSTRCDVCYKRQRRD